MKKPRSIYYTVKSGDTLSKIALREYGNTKYWKNIAANNNLRYPYVIVVGMKLSLNLITDDEHIIGNRNAHEPLGKPMEPVIVAQTAPVGKFDTGRTKNIDYISQSKRHLYSYSDFTDWIIGDKQATDVYYPTLRFTVEGDSKKRTFRLVGGFMFVSLNYELNIQNNGVLPELEISPAGIKGLTVGDNDNPVEFKGDGKSIDSIKVEYKTQLDNIWASSSANYNFRNGSFEVEFGVGSDKEQRKVHFSVPPPIGKKIYAFTVTPQPISLSENGFSMTGLVGFTVGVIISDNNDGASYATATSQLFSEMAALPKMQKIYLGVAGAVALFGLLRIAKNVPADLVAGAAASISFGSAMNILSGQDQNP